jgi:hypothetical protein
MKLLQLGIASSSVYRCLRQFQCEERTHFTDAIPALLILAPHLSQFMTTFNRRAQGFMNLLVIVVSGV